MARKALKYKTLLEFVEFWVLNYVALPAYIRDVRKEADKPQIVSLFAISA